MDSPIPRRPVSPDDLFRLKFVLTAQLSPDGRTVVYALSQVDASKEVETVGLHLVSVETGESRALTSGSARDWNPQWSPDGTRIAFLSNRGGAPQIYTIRADGGEAEALTHIPTGVRSGPLWSPDGSRIAFSARQEGAQPRDPSRPYRITRRVYRIDAIGYLDDAIQEVYTIETANGVTRQLTHGDYMKVPVAWTPDGKEILFSASGFPDSSILGARLWAVDDSCEVRQIIEDWGYATTASCSPDGKRIVFIGNHEGFPSGTIHAKLWVMDRAGGEPECRCKSLKGQVDGWVAGDTPALQSMMPVRPIVSEDGTSALIRVQTGGCTGIYRMALDGPEDWAPVVSGDRVCTPLGMASGRLLFGARDADNPADLYICNLDGSREKRLTDVNADVLSGLQLQPHEPFSFTSGDGVRVEGWLVRPEAGRAPFPTILHIHGGPASASGFGFHFEGQMLASAGFAVAFVNYRGSMGYGDEFSTPIRGDLGRLEFMDLMAALDYLVERGIADPNRLGSCGTSYGGYLTCLSVGRTRRLGAASAENPIVSFFTMFGCSHAPQWEAAQLGGRPDEAYETYRRSSPITYAHNCTTPTLLIQGELDYCCPPEESEQFYATLRANGCPSEMLRLPNSSHGGATAGPIASRRAQNEGLLEWMTRWIGPGAAPKTRPIP